MFWRASVLQISTIVGRNNALLPKMARKASSQNYRKIWYCSPMTLAGFSTLYIYNIPSPSRKTENWKLGVYSERKKMKLAQWIIIHVDCSLLKQHLALFSALIKASFKWVSQHKFVHIQIKGVFSVSEQFGWKQQQAFHCCVVSVLYCWGHFKAWCLKEAISF